MSHSLPELNFRFVDRAGDVRLHVVEAGVGPVVLLVHGFPEFWFSWRNQIAPLVAAGFRVVMPDLRGYNLSSKPPAISAYALDHLVADVDAVARSCGDEIFLVGHDWGGLIGWYVAATRAAWLKKLVVVNCAHPVSLRNAMKQPSQLARLWYIAALQLPLIPEWLVTRRGHAVLRKALRAGSAAEAFTDSDLNAYVEAWSREGAVHSMINYYRANARKGPAIRGIAREPECPTLTIWGERDPVFTKKAMQLPSSWTRARIARLPDTGHFPQAEDPASVNRILVDFLRE